MNAHRVLRARCFSHAAASSTPARPIDGLGFSGGGLLFPYYLGVIAALRAHGRLHPTGPSLPCAGSSAGSLAAALAVSGVDTSLIAQKLSEYLHDLRTRGTPGRMRPGLHRVLDSVIPPDLHEKAAGKCFISIFRLGSKLSLPRGEVVSVFHSRKDLIDALLASCHLPLYFEYVVQATS